MDNQNKFNFQNNLNDFFENISYSDQYSVDIWITIIAIFIVLVIAIYFFIINKLKSFRAEWYKYKCNPFFMPFASVINPQKNDADGDYTYKNFSNCMNDLNRGINIDVGKPIDDIQNIINSVFAMASGITTQLQEYIIYLFKLLIALYQFIISKLKVFIDELNIQFININDFLGKIMGIFSVFYYSIMLTISSFKLMFTICALLFLGGVVIPAIIATTLAWVIFFVIIAIITILIVWSWFPPISITVGILVTFAIILLIVALVTTVFMIILIMMYGILVTFASDVLKESLPNAPKSKHG
tara:strand:- start:3946 stop:4842 length:897 start_codon:yes stop_codon:yes gene_type:complete